MVIADERHRGGEIERLAKTFQRSLTKQGIVQWLQARNRYLNGRRPIDVLAEGEAPEVLEAANAYSEGVYL